MDGKLIEKKEIKFSNGFVKNFSPLEGKNGSGSVEIKITSKENLRIPYAAIVAIYKTRKGITEAFLFEGIRSEKVKI